jgi:FkbM family methyltransferase
MSLLGNLAGALRRQWWPKRQRDPEHFERYVRGVVHVGANTGQERLIYDRAGLNVLWIESIPSVYETLVANIRALPKQRAVCALVTDRDGVETPFHIANNDGKSSSILDLKHHADIYPDIKFKASITLTSTTLTTLFAREGVNAADYDALVMDTQGSELLVLEGALPLLRGFEYIKTEVADFESYAGCCQLADIEAFMRRHGYSEIWRRKFSERPQGGAYYDVTYRKNALRRLLSR